MALDFVLIDGDLVINADGSGDLLLEPHSLMRRALETPFGYLGVFTSEGIIDREFGNAIYSLQSEAISLTWVAEAKEAVQAAADLAGEEVRQVTINVVEDQVIIQVYFQQTSTELRLAI